MTSLLRTFSEEPIPKWMHPPCAVCGDSQRAIPSDPDYLCEYCLLDTRGIAPAEDQSWLVDWLAGWRFGDEWSEYHLDYVYYVVETDSDDKRPIHRIYRGDDLYQLREVRLQRAFRAGFPLYAESAWRPDLGWKVGFRGVENSVPSDWSSGELKRLMKLLGHFNDGRGRPRRELQKNWPERMAHVEAVLSLNREYGTSAFDEYAFREAKTDPRELNRWIETYRNVHRNRYMELTRRD